MSERMRSRRAGVLAVLVLVLTATAVLATIRDDTDPEEDTQQHTVVTLAAKDIRFEPTTLTLPVGVPVRLEFVNDGTVEHDVSIPGVGMMDLMEGVADAHEQDGYPMDDAMVDTVHLNAHPGERVGAVFTPKAGTFEMLCTVPGHREAGMVGRVVVE